MFPIDVLRLKHGFNGGTIIMTLQSTLFRGDPKLDAAAVSDPAHIVAGAKGPHVVKIQQALIQLDGAAITADGAYGQGTATAVSTFKQKRQILNFQGKIDDIVGKKTIAALDSEMIAAEKKGGGSSRLRLGFNVSAPPTATVQVVNQPPSDPPFPLTILPDNDGQKDADDATARPLKEDLDSRPRQLKSRDFLARVRVWAAKLGLGSSLQDEIQKAGLDPFSLTTFLARMLVAGKLDRAAFDEIGINDVRNFPDVDINRRLSVRAVAVNEKLLRNEMSVGGPTAINMFNFWTSNGASPPILKNFPALDADTAKTGAFIKAAERFESRLRENLQRQFALGLVDFKDLVTGPGPKRRDDNIPPIEPGKSTGRPLPAVEPILPDLSIFADTVVKICIGSFQGIRVFLTNFQATVAISPVLPSQFSGKLIYELRDHFGVDDEDCEVASKGIHGTPGQVAMWVLQHFAPAGHKPFIDQVLVRRDFSGTF